MNRPTGWPANPQAMALATKRTRYTGHPALGLNIDDDTWLTPTWILEQLGKFDLDPCAAECFPQRVCERYFTRSLNGLVQIWTGRVFCNPPFSDVAPWIEKHAYHRSGVTLVTASVESQVWRNVVWKRATAIKLLAGRTRFCRPDGSVTTGRPLRPIALIAWSDSDAEIIAETTFAGVLLRTWQQK